MQRTSKRTAFFSLGLDPLQSIQMRNEILRSVDIGYSKLSQNVVFEYPSIVALSSHLYGLRSGNMVQENTCAVEDDMIALVEKYSALPPRPARHTVVVTGATGSLGAHVAAQLAARSDVARVICLRAKDAE